MTTEPQTTTLEEQEFALAYAIEKCLDTKFDGAEFRAIREVCRKELNKAYFYGQKEFAEIDSFLEEAINEI